MTIEREVTSLSPNESAPTHKEQQSLGRDLLHAAHYYLGGRRGWIALAAVAVAGGLVLNWSWLVAVGVAPLLLGILPCAAMCALGLCMGRMGRSSSSSGDSSADRSTGNTAEGMTMEQPADDSASHRADGPDK